MKDHLNELIHTINFSIKSINTQHHLYHTGNPIKDIPIFYKNPDPFEIPALRDLLSITASVCRAYEKELWKDKWDLKFIGELARDIIQRRDLIVSIIEDIQ